MPLAGFLPLLQLSLSGGAIGEIGSVAGSSLGVLKYLIYIIPAIIVGFVIWMLWQRKSGNASKGVISGGKGGQNVAYIISLTHRVIAEKKPFNIKRFYDKDKNIETTRAIFPAPKEKKSLKEFIAAIFNRGKPKTEEEDDGPVFSENLSIYDRERQGWFTYYTLETNTQIAPAAIDKTDYITKIIEIERNTERRVARLKAAQLAIQNYVSNATPIERYGQMQLIGMILLFIGIIALAITLNSVGTTVTQALHTVMQIRNVSGT